ncbi:MAG: dethiobiotin synthase [Nitrospirae bacterium]|nr:dethiobiotin synthase [Nitrospirota bacterium]MBI3594997.1 dethiobiotin synthase [Nitrospirota bacterium]
MGGLIGRHKRFFIAGTDTEVGKTYFACRFIEQLIARGEKVGILKPIETGILTREDSDAVRLITAARSNIPIESVSPYRFRTAAAPRVAARLEKRRIDPRRIVTSFESISSQHRWMVVEGAGGLRVPIQKHYDMTDLILALGIPVILVSLQRIGAINQTLLSLHFAKDRGLNVLAVILNQPEAFPAESPLHENQKMIGEECDVPILTFRSRKSEAGRNFFWKKLLG